MLDLFDRHCRATDGDLAEEVDWQCLEELDIELLEGEDDTQCLDDE